MSKRLVIEPHWMHNLLMHWSTVSFRNKGALGYPTTCLMFKERVQFKAQQREPFELTQDDYDDVSLAVSELETKHRLAITRAYKPWQIEAISQDTAAYGVTDRTWQNWCHAAAIELARKLERRVDKVQKTA